MDGGGVALGAHVEALAGDAREGGPYDFGSMRDGGNAPRIGLDRL
jgi:hypothetical protein